MHALVEKLAEQFDDSRSHPGKPTRQRIRPEQEQPAGLGFLQRLAHAAGVTAHQVQLQLPRLCRLNVFGGEAAEACRHAIDNLLLPNHLLDKRPGALHGPPRARVERHATILKNHRVEILARQVLSSQEKGTSHSVPLTTDNQQPTTNG
jgi:hypothetical protein